MSTPHNTPVATPVAVIQSTVFAFKARPDIAPEGLQKGAFISAINEKPEKPQPAGKEFNRLVVTVALDATDSQGQQFMVKKVYNLLGRGTSVFLDDFNAWSESKMQEKDLYTKFNSAAMINGKPVVVEIDHRKVGTKWEAYIKGFFPANYTGATQEALAA